MTIETLRFGQVEIDEKKIYAFKDGLPGLEEYKTFVLLNFTEYFPILWLQSTEDSRVCLPVMDFFMAVSEYAFDISNEDKKDLALENQDDVYVVNVLVLPDELANMTVNLAAPIIMNMRTFQAKQIILTGGDYNVRYPIFQEMCRLIKEGEADAGSVTENK